MNLLKIYKTAKLILGDKMNMTPWQEKYEKVNVVDTCTCGICCTWSRLNTCERTLYASNTTPYLVTSTQTHANWKTCLYKSLNICFLINYTNDILVYIIYIRSSTSLLSNDWKFIAFFSHYMLFKTDVIYIFRFVSRFHTLVNFIDFYAGLIIFF